MSQHRFLGYGRQCLDDDDIQAVVDVLKGDYLTQGPAVEAFEHALAAKVGARHAIAVTSGTAALHIACLVAGIGPGDWGLTSTLTFVASANGYVYCGGNAALADVDADGLGITGAGVAAAIAARPEIKAVTPVHFAGLAVQAEEIRAAAAGRVVIEDASHSLGSFYPDGRPVGCCAHSDMTVFSFHPVKPITTGEGGAVMTNDDGLAKCLRMLRNHGIEREPGRFEDVEAAFENGKPRPWYYEQQELGFNYRMTDIQAALGLSQLKKLDAFTARRRQIAARYDEAFADLELVRRPQSSAADRARSGLHLYVVEIDFERLGLSRAQVMGLLRERGIGVQTHYIPVHRQPFHRRRHGFAAADFPVTEAYYARCLSLPLHADLDDAEVERVIGVVKPILSGAVKP